MVNEAVFGADDFQAVLANLQRKIVVLEHADLELRVESPRLIPNLARSQNAVERSHRDLERLAFLLLRQGRRELLQLSGSSVGNVDSSLISGTVCYRDHRAYIGVLLHVPNQAAQPCARDDGIDVEHDQEFSSGSRGADVCRRGEAQVRGKPDQTDALVGGAILRDHLPRVVAGVVIHNPHFVAEIGCVAADGMQAGVDEVAAIVRDDDNRDGCVPWFG